MKQRLIVLGSTVVGGSIWLGAVPALKAAGGGHGISLTTAQAGVAPSALSMLLYGLPALILAVITASTGHLVAGMFVLGAAMMFLAASGGSMADWLWSLQASLNPTELPNAYQALIAEVIGLQVAIIAAFVIIQQFRKQLRPIIPHEEGRSPIDEVADHHPQPTVGVIQVIAALLVLIIALMFGWVIISGVLIVAIIAGLFALQRAFKTVPAYFAKIASSLLCAVIAGMVGLLLIRNADIGQVLASLVVAFMIGGIVAQTVFPQHNPIGVFASPVIVAVLAYVMAMQLEGQQIRDSWYGIATSFSPPSGLALALPIHYMSAGVVGVCMGLGVAKAFEQAKPVEEDSSDE